MMCVECERKSPPGCTSEQPRGWYLWPKGAPVRYHGLVLCPTCRLRPAAALLIHCAEEDAAKKNTP